MDLSNLQHELNAWWTGWLENRYAYRGRYRNGQLAPKEPVLPKPKKVQRFRRDDD
jgi:hypothetical protein